jgi:hypothetical protein
MHDNFINFNMVEEKIMFGRNGKAADVMVSI